jgi:hypothetical protein
MKGVRRTGLAGLAAIALIIAAVRWSEADEIPPCRLVPTGVSVVNRLEDAPPSLVHALTERVGEVAPIGTPFDSTDVIRTGGKNRRLIFIWNRGTRWVIATEHGGLGYNDPVYAFEIDQDNRKVTLLRAETAFPSTVCSTASSLLVIGTPAYISTPPSNDRTR